MRSSISPHLDRRRRSPRVRGCLKASAMLLAAVHLTVGAQTPVPVPVPYTATYEISMGGLPVGELKRTLRATSGRFSLESVSEATGLAALFMGTRIEEVSEFTVTEGGEIAPVRYRYQTFGRKARVRETEFRADQSRVSGVRDGAAWSLQLSADDFPLYDPLAYQIEMASDVAAGERAPSYRVILKGKVLEYRFTYEGTESITIGGQPVETLKFTRRVEPPEITEIWVAPSHHYQPVRVRVTDDDNTTTVAVLKHFFTGETRAVRSP